MPDESGDSWEWDGAAVVKSMLESLTALASIASMIWIQMPEHEKNLLVARFTRWRQEVFGPTRKEFTSMTKSMLAQATYIVKEASHGR